MPLTDPENPYPDAPEYPEDAEWFVFEGTPPSVRLDQITDRLGEDADAEDAREALPPWAEFDVGGISRDSVTFPQGSPVPPIAVDEHQWKMRASQGQITPLDADGHRLPSFRDPDPLVEGAMGWLDGLDAQPDDDDADPLADVTADDLEKMDYHALRSLAQPIDGVSGNATRDEIEDALVAELRDRNADAAPSGEGSA